MDEHWNELMNGFFLLPMQVLLSSCDRVKPLGQEHSKYPGLFSQPSLQPDIPSVHSLISVKIAIIIKEVGVVIIVFIIFMACRAGAIPVIAFPWVRTIYIYICMSVSLVRLCVVYIVLEVASLWGAQSINGSGA